MFHEQLIINACYIYRLLLTLTTPEKEKKRKAKEKGVQDWDRAPSSAASATNQLDGCFINRHCYRLDHIKLKKGKQRSPTELATEIWWKIKGLKQSMPIYQKRMKS